MFRNARRVAARLLIFSVFAAFFFSIPSSSFATETISVATLRGAPTMRWPLHIADAKGMFAAEGVNLEFDQVVFASNIAQSVTAGSVDLGTVGLVEPVRVVAKGGNVAIIREEGALPPFVLMAKPGIKSITDLKGKVVSLGGAADSSRAYFERMLTSVHMTIDQVDKVYAGSTADRFAQLKSGAVDASLLLPPFDTMAQEAGFTNLGNSKDFVKALPFSGYMVNKPWAESHRDLVKKFLTAYQKAVDWFYDPKNRDEAVAIALKVAPGDAKSVGQSYDTLRALQFFAKSDAVSKQDLTNLIKVVNQLGPLDHPVEPKQLVLPGITNYLDN